MKQGELFTDVIPQINKNPKSQILLNWLITTAEKKKIIVIASENIK